MFWEVGYVIEPFTIASILSAVLIVISFILFFKFWAKRRFDLWYIWIPIFAMLPFYLYVSKWQDILALKAEFDTGAANIVEGVIVKNQRYVENGAPITKVKIGQQIIQLDRTGGRNGCSSSDDINFEPGTFLRVHVIWLKHSDERVKEPYPCLVKVEYWVCHPPPFEDYTHNCKKENLPQLGRTNSSLDGTLHWVHEK
jgi:hypothetical protein